MHRHGKRLRPARPPVNYGEESVLSLRPARPPVNYGEESVLSLRPARPPVNYGEESVLSFTRWLSRTNEIDLNMAESLGRYR